MFLVQGVLLATRALSVTGATDKWAEIVNGMYDPTEEVVDGVTAYRKRGDADMWLQYSKASKDWSFQNLPNRGTGNAYAFVVCDPLRLPDQCEGLVWRIARGSSHVACPSLTVTVSECSTRHPASEY